MAVNSICLLVLALAVPGVLGGVAGPKQQFKLEHGQWKAIAQIDPSSPEGQIQEIRRKIAEEDPKQAQKLATKWIEQYPNHPLLVEAYLSRGDALVGRRLYFKALYDYEYVIRVFPASTQFATALEREFEIARLFSGGMKRKWIGLRIMRADDEAEEIFIRIQERSPGSEIAEQASIALGDYYFARSQMTSAALAYELYLENYPSSRYRQKAMLRLIQANLATFKGPQFDATGLIEAAQRLKLFQREYPVAAEKLGARALLVRVAESLALKMFYRGNWYERVGQQISAVYLYQRVAADHPQTVAAQAAIRRLKQLDKPINLAAVTESSPH